MAPRRASWLAALLSLSWLAMVGCGQPGASPSDPDTSPDASVDDASRPPDDAQPGEDASDSSPSDASNDPSDTSDDATTPPEDADAQPDMSDAPPSDAADGGEDAFEPDPVERCAEVDAFGPVFPQLIARWEAQDAQRPWPEGSVVFVGSSSIRRWEGLGRAYTDHSPLQRGFGGAQLGEVALFEEALIARHQPRAVVVFAGTNDISAGVSPEVVVERFRCLRQRVGRSLGWDKPLIFIGITPTIARWEQWPAASEVNARIEALAQDDPGLFYADVPARFLETGSPPAERLFAADRLHLSDEGYALWDSALRPVVEAATTPTTPVAGPVEPVLAPGTRVLIDLGPDNPEDGERTPSPDYLGQHWNNWHSLAGGGEVLPGERLSGLVTASGEATGLELIVTGGFQANGRRNGGLLWPEAERLGDLAVGSATGDFFYATADDRTGGLMLRGLDPARRYTLRLFAGRSDPQRRVTTYAVEGAGRAVASLQTSGSGAGSQGGNGNDDEVVALTGLAPDAWGHLFIDVSLTEGDYAYLGLLELVAE